MTKQPRTETRQVVESAPAARRGPVPLDSALLVHVSGGSETEQAPHSRWAPIEQSAGDERSAPHSRW